MRMQENTNEQASPNEQAGHESGGKLETIQLLRAIAVFAVLVSHAMWEIRELLEPMGVAVRDKLFPGDFGVDLFFVISGFIMVYTTRSAAPGLASAVDFMKRRIIRIVPLYWIMTTVMIAVLLVLPDSAQTATRDPFQWLQSYLFIPFERAYDGLARPVLGLGWSLNYEMFFYLVFAVGLFLPRLFGLLFTVVGISLFAIAGQLGLFEVTALRVLAESVILEFAFGIVLGWLYLSGVRISKPVAAVGAVAGLLILFLAPEYSDTLSMERHLFFGIPALLFVMAAVMVPGADSVRISRASLVMGEISYSTYLTHPFVLGAMTIIWSKAGWLPTLLTPTGVAAYLAATLFFSLLVAFFTHYLLDKPLTGWLASRFVKRRSNIPSHRLPIGGEDGDRREEAGRLQTA